MTAEINHIVRLPNGRFRVVLTRGEAEPIEVDCAASDLANYTSLQSKILLASGVDWREASIERLAKARERRREYDDLIRWAISEGAEA